MMYAVSKLKKENIKIDYGKMANSTKKNDNNLQDISSLVDDLF